MFSSFRFPIPLFKITKLEIREEYVKLGFEKTMHKTWFCHTPINNEPCGMCNPCKSVVEEGLSFRLTDKALKRYKAEMAFGKYKWYRYLKAIRRRNKGD